MATSDYICELTAQVNALNQAVRNIQSGTGLSSDSSDDKTLTGRVKALEESTITSDPSEVNISRMKVESGLIASDGKFNVMYYPIGGCVNNEVMVQHPDFPEIWETVGGVTFSEDEGDLGTTEYDGWKITVSYIYAVKITYIEKEFIDVDKELVMDLSEQEGSVYKVKFTITPIDGEDDDEDPDECTLRWENADDEDDYTEDTINDIHIRTIDESEFNHKLYISGSADINIEVKNRLG